MALTVALIAARGGSKGIPRKNLAELCGKPLVAWSIIQARAAEAIDSVWVSSDSEEILRTSAEYGAQPVKRPDEISGDEAPSEAAWRHALDVVEAKGGPVERVVAMQATSPIREPADLDAALEDFGARNLDSMLSVTEIEDFFIWKMGPDERPEPVNYDHRNRRRRQLIEKRYLENGSFYIFKPEILRRNDNRLGGRIGLHVMARYKMFQVDTAEDLALCSAILRGYGLDRV